MNGPHPGQLRPQCGCSSPAADAVIPAGDAQRLSVDKTRRDLLPRAFVDLLYGGAGNVHLGGTLLMGALFQIHQPDDLIFVQRQQDRRSAPAPVRAEGIDLRFAAGSFGTAVVSPFIRPLRFRYMPIINQLFGKVNRFLPLRSLLMPWNSYGGLSP